MIVVTGGNGQLGRAVLDGLAARLPASEIGTSVRNPEQAERHRRRGIRVRRGDFNDPATLANALEGASQLLIVSVDGTGAPAVQQHRAAIEAAKDVGIPRILYTSHMGASPHSHFAPMIDHHRTEAALEQSGIPYVSLRNGFYASTVTRLLASAMATGTLRAPDDGPVSWTAHTDLAEATVHALMHPADYPSGSRPVLTGQESLDMNAIAAAASEVTGRQIVRVSVSDDDYRSDLISGGAPPEMADLIVGMFAASRAGEFSDVKPTLATVIGRDTTSVRTLLHNTFGRSGTTGDKTL